MRPMKTVATAAGLFLAVGLVLVTIACFHSGVSWIPEAFSFLGNLFGA